MQSRTRTLAGILALAALMTALLASAAAAQVIVSEVWYEDSFYEPGGYYEFTVNNNSGDDIYLVMVGNDIATVIFRRPDLVPVWDVNTCNSAEWGPDCPTFSGTTWTPPDFTDVTFASLFGSYYQVLIYSAIGSNPPIATGTSLEGFRWLPPVPTNAPASTAFAGSPFAVYNGSGDLVAQGTTTGSPLATEARTWGGVKALYR